MPFLCAIGTNGTLRFCLACIQIKHYDSWLTTDSVITGLRPLQLVSVSQATMTGLVGRFKK